MANELKLKTMTAIEDAQKKTDAEYNQVISAARELFSKKLVDYGPSWQILRLSSLTDKIYIKAQRIRSIQESGRQKIDEGIDGEFIGIINYATIALIQIWNSSTSQFSNEECLVMYDDEIARAKELMHSKNHDYGEAWRSMRVSSMTDLILMKLLRIKQIEDNKGETIASEGVAANYQDIINYAVFALILMKNK